MRVGKVDNRIHDLEGEVLLGWILDSLGAELLTPSTVLHLRKASLLNDEDVVSIQLDRMLAGCAMSPGEERIASLFHAEAPEAFWLLEEIVGDSELTARESETILIARLLAIRRSWDVLDEPGFYIESELDEWGSPSAYEAVRFSSTPPRGQGGLEKYLARLDAHLQNRIDVLRLPPTS